MAIWWEEPQQLQETSLANLKTQCQQCLACHDANVTHLSNGSLINGSQSAFSAVCSRIVFLELTPQNRLLHQVRIRFHPSDTELFQLVCRPSHRADRWPPRPWTCAPGAGNSPSRPGRSVHGVFFMYQGFRASARRLGPERVRM